MSDPLDSANDDESDPDPRTVAEEITNKEICIGVFPLINPEPDETFFVRLHDPRNSTIPDPPGEIRS